MFNLEESYPKLNEKFNQNMFEYAEQAIDTYMTDVKSRILVAEMSFDDDVLFEKVPTIEEIQKDISEFTEIADKDPRLYSFKPFILYNFRTIMSLLRSGNDLNICEITIIANWAEQLEAHEFAKNNQLGDSDIFYKYLYIIYDSLADDLATLKFTNGSFKYRARAIEMIRKIDITKYVFDRQRYLDEIKDDDIFEEGTYARPDFSEDLRLYFDIIKTLRKFLNISPDVNNS